MPILADNLLTVKAANFDGRELSELSIKWNADIPIPKIIADKKRNRFYFIDISGLITCRDFEGAIIWQKQIAANPVFSYENTYFASLINSQDELIAAFSQPVSDLNGNVNTFLLRISAEGEITDSSKLENEKALNFSMNESGTRIALMTQSVSANSPRSIIRTALFNSRLEQIWTDNISFRACVFPNNQSCLILQKNTVIRIDLVSGKQLWQEKLKGQRFFDKIIPMQDSGFVTISGVPLYLSGKLFYENPEISFYDESNTLSGRVILEDKQYVPGAIKPGIENNLTIGCRDGLYRIWDTER